MGNISRNLLRIDGEEIQPVIDIKTWEQKRPFSPDHLTFIIRRDQPSKLPGEKKRLIIQPCPV
jgi:hypothetical protein